MNSVKWNYILNLIINHDLYFYYLSVFFFNFLHLFKLLEAKQGVRGNNGYKMRQSQHHRHYLVVLLRLLGGAFDLAKTINHDVERPLGSNPRVELLERARSCPR